MKRTCFIYRVYGFNSNLQWPTRNTTRLPSRFLHCFHGRIVKNNFFDSFCALMVVTNCVYLGIEVEMGSWASRMVIVLEHDSKFIAKCCNVIMIAACPADCVVGTVLCTDCPTDLVCGCVWCHFGAGGVERLPVTPIGNPKLFPHFGFLTLRPIQDRYFWWLLSRKRDKKGHIRPETPTLTTALHLHSLCRHSSRRPSNMVVCCWLLGLVKVEITQW